MTTNQIKALAIEFSKLLHRDLTTQQYAEVLARNASETDASICHTHDFIDANETMVEATENYFDDLDESEEEALITELGTIQTLAWAMAKAGQFNTVFIERESDLTSYIM